MAKQALEGLMRGANNLYSLPTIYFELDRKINDPLSDLEDIAEVLLDDAGLSARLLRIANSALYNFPSKIDTITRAITIIGTKQLRDLALATSVISAFKGIDKSVIDMESFWRHSIAVGVAARSIASHHLEHNIERFYLMGLLHDIGRIVMFDQMPAEMSDLLSLCQEQSKPLNVCEKAALGYDHTKVGQQLLQQWRLPASIADAVGYHHSPLSSRDYTREATIVHVADIMINALELGSSGGRVVPPLNEQAWEGVGIPVGQLPELLAHIESQYHAVVEVFLA